MLGSAGRRLAPCVRRFSGSVERAVDKTFTPPPPPPEPRTTYRDPVDRDAPKHLRVQHATEMGKIDFDAVPPQTVRTVPKSAKEYALNRREYKKQLSVFRKQYKAEWDQRRARETEAIRFMRERLNAAKAERLSAKAQRRHRNLKKHERQMELDWHARRLRKELNQAARRAFFEEVTTKRRGWLDDLEADAEDWIPEDKIDDLITEETFAMTYAWQYEPWYAQQERRRRAEAAHTGEGFLAESGTTDASFAEDWDSDVEEDDEFAPLNYMQQTGLQLEELYAQKRTPALIEEFQAWKNAYIEEHYDKADWDYLKSMSDDSVDGPEGVSGGSASPAAAAAAVPESTPTKAELDDIYDLISQDAAKTDSDK